MLEDDATNKLPVSKLEACSVVIIWMINLRFSWGWVL